MSTSICSPGNVGFVPSWLGGLLPAPIDAKEEPRTGGCPHRGMSVRGEEPWPSLGTSDVRPWGAFSGRLWGVSRVRRHAWLEKCCFPQKECRFQDSQYGGIVLLGRDRFRRGVAGINEHVRSSANAAQHQVILPHPAKVTVKFPLQRKGPSVPCWESWIHRRAGARTSRREPAP